MMTEEQTAFQKVITLSYTDVKVGSDGINTAQFLEATDGMVNMFGKFVYWLWLEIFNLFIIYLFRPFWKQRI